MKLRKYKYKRAITSAIAGSALLAGPSWADDAKAPVAVSTTTQTIEISGIRASLQKARDEKRVSNEILDAVSSEDIGKFPDKNIAEALQRVPGVTIDRNRGEGDFVSVRGLPAAFLRGTVNNRTIVSATESFNSTLSGGEQTSTGRETNFDVLPSEIVDLIQVYKSNSAEQVEGGVAGVVNIQTARPLKLGNRIAFSASDLYSELSGKHSPNLSGLWSWKSEDQTFGALASLTYSERHIRQGVADSFAYSPASTFGASDKVDATGSGHTTATGVLYPFSLNPENFEEDRKNHGFNATLQWRPASGTEISFDALLEQRKLEHTSLQAIYQVSPLLFSSIYPGVGSPVGATNPDGSVQFPGLVVGPSNTAARYQTAADLTSVTDVQAGADKSANLGLHGSHRLGDWKLSADLAQAKATGNESFDRATFMPKASGQAIPGLVTVTTTGGNIAVTPSATFAQSIADPNLYSSNNFQQDRRRNEDTEQSLRLDAERTLSGAGPFSAIKFGVRESKRNKDLHVTGLATGAFKDASGAPVSVALNAANAGLTHLPANLVPGVDMGGDMSVIPFAQDPGAVIATIGKLAKPGTLDQVFNALQSFHVGEKTSAAYGQLEIDTTVLGLPVSGNMGLRLVRTSTSSVGYRRPFTIVTTNNIGAIQYTSPDVSTLSASSSDTHLLPSLNLKADFTTDLVGRFSYSRSLTRPLFSDLTPAYTGSPNPTQHTASIGNPDLKPLVGDNFDLGAEWYQGRDGMVSAGLFYKRLDGVVATTTRLNTNYDNNNWVSLSQPDNLGAGSIQGFEIGTQAPFNFLPAALRGAGGTFNYTRTNSSIHDKAGVSMPFPGVSKYSLNASVYYEQGPLQLRAAYTFRDQYMVLASDVFGQQVFSKGYGQVDLTAGYDLSKSVALFANAINIGNAREVLYSSNSMYPASADSRPQSVSAVGRRYLVGVRVKL